MVTQNGPSVLEPLAKIGRNFFSSSFWSRGGPDYLADQVSSKNIDICGKNFKNRLFEKNGHPFTWTPTTPRKKIFIQKKF
jgi:hypothetical protein